MSGQQFLTEEELNTVKGLVHYLNTNVRESGSNLHVEAKIIDTNGETVGVVQEVPGRSDETPGYALHFPAMLDG